MQWYFSRKTLVSIISAFHANISTFKKKTGIILGIISEKYEHYPEVYSDAIVKSTIQQKLRYVQTDAITTNNASTMLCSVASVLQCVQRDETTPNNTQHNATGYANGRNV